MDKMFEAVQAKSRRGIRAIVGGLEDYMSWREVELEGRRVARGAS